MAVMEVMPTVSVCVCVCMCACARARHPDYTSFAVTWFQPGKSLVFRRHGKPLYHGRDLSSGFTAANLLARTLASEHTHTHAYTDKFL